VLASCAWAQTPAQPVVRFTVFSAKPLQNVAFATRGAGTLQAVTFYPTARSPRYEYRGFMPLRFLDATTGAILAEAVIPAELRDVLLLFSPLDSAAADKKAAGLRYQVAVLDDSVGRHPVGGLSIINLSGLDLSGSVGKEPVSLRAGLNPTVQIGRASTPVVFKSSFKQKSYQAYAGTVRLAAKQRALLILFPPFYPGSLEVQSRLLLDEP
jgi:hypothetical protein